MLIFHFLRLIIIYRWALQNKSRTMEIRVSELIGIVDSHLIAVKINISGNLKI